MNKALTQVISRIQELINRQEVIEAWLQKQSQQPRQALTDAVTQRQHLAELELLVNRLHPADIALLLESVPPEQRTLIWNHVEQKSAGAVLLEASDPIRQQLIRQSHSDDLSAVAKHLENDEIADLVHDLPKEIIPDLLSSLPGEDRDAVRSALSFPEHCVGAWMEFDITAVTQHMSLDDVLSKLRDQGELPDNTGYIMVTDEAGSLTGMLTLEDLLIHRGQLSVAEVMSPVGIYFQTRDQAEDAARSFERYELIIAPVVNSHNKLVGVLRVSALMDLMDKLAQQKMLAQAGLSNEENLFDPISRSARNRWPWIALNLLIVFIASQIIDQFEQVISQTVALAALLPITANIGGNAGNQVVALVIRGLATQQLAPDNRLQLVRKELSVALLNGALWGTITGFLTLLLYQNLNLGLVMLLAMFCTMLFAACIGVGIPILLKAMGQDPALGSSVIITGTTDTLGFFIFLGLAAMIL